METPIDTTTRQAAALRLSLAARAGSERALLEGIDLYTGEPVFSDPISDYAMRDGPRSPSRLTVGGVGEGKSTVLKTGSVLRPLLLGRRSAIADKKIEGGASEYTPVCEKLGVRPIRHATDGSGVKINVFDRRIAPAGAGGNGAGQTQLLRAILAEALGGPISARAGKALRMGHRQALGKAMNEHYVADIRHLVPAMLLPDETACREAHVSQGELRDWGLDAAFALERLIEEDLAGLIDGDTDPSVELNSSLTVFDISSLPNDGPAAAIVMAIISSWLGYTLRSQGPRAIPTHFVVEEGWHLMRGNFAAVAEANNKLARGTALVPEYAIHHLTDLPPNGPAMALIKEAGSVRIFRQSTGEDADAVIRTFGLPPSMKETLTSLDVGTFMYWQSGRKPRVVQGLRSDLERQIADTDSAMLSKATMHDLYDLLQQTEVEESPAGLATADLGGMPA